MYISKTFHGLLICFNRFYGVFDAFIISNALYKKSDPTFNVFFRVCLLGTSFKLALASLEVKLRQPRFVVVNMIHKDLFRAVGRIIAGQRAEYSVAAIAGRSLSHVYIAIAQQGLSIL